MPYIKCPVPRCIYQAGVTDHPLRRNDEGRLRLPHLVHRDANGRELVPVSVIGREALPPRDGHRI